MNKQLDVSKLKESMNYPKNRREETDEWRNFDQANCYQFALTIVLDIFDRLLPGQISGHEIDVSTPYTDEDLKGFVKEDLEVLGYEMVSCEKNVKLEDGEWEIAILNCSKLTDPNFHFLRKIAGKDRDWMQKYVGEQKPTTFDCMGQRVTDPAIARYYYKYHLVGYFRIRKKMEAGG